MKIRYKEAAVVVEKGVVVSFEAGYRAVSAHPFLAVFVCFLYLLYCFLPGLFAFLANSSPVILCTTILLGALLSHGNPNIPDIDDEGEEPAAQDHGARSRSIFIEKEQERDGDSIGKSPENDVAVRQVEDDREKKVDDGGFVCLDPSSSLQGLLLKKAVDVSGDASKSGSDGEESCSPDASMADIQPLLDELHPFFNPEICRPVRVNIDDTDDTSGTYSGDEESEVDSSSEEEEDEDASETRQLLKGAGHAAAADDDDDDDDDSLDATAWNADDMRNFKDLKSSELERNRRLENLIAKRMARKNVTELGNFIDLDQSTLDRYSNLQISNVSKSKSKSNPFDDPEESNDLPPIPSSAPSVFSKRNNPFDFHQPFMPGRNFPSTDNTYRESATPGVGDNSYAHFQAELAGKDRSKLSTIPESEPDYIPYSSLPPMETSNVDAALREPLLSLDGQNLEENIMIQSMADDENEHVTTEAHSIAEFDVIPDHYLVCDVAKIAEPPLDESGVELPTDLSTDNEFKLSSSDSKYESLLSELDAIGDFSTPQNDQMFQQHSDSDQTGSYSNSNSNSDSDSTVEIEAASPKQHAESESGNESDSAAPKEGKEESKNIDSSSDSGTHKTSEVHSELHEAGDTHFVLIHDRESIEDKRENPTEEKEHTDDMDVDDDLSFSLPEDMDVALKRLFRQNTMKTKGLLEDGADSEKQQEDLHWELRRLFRQNTLKKRSNLDETEKQQQEEDFLSALTLLFKEKTTTFAQEKDNGDDDDDDDTAVQDMHMALKRLFRQFSFAPERSNVLKDEEDFEQCDKKVEMDTVEMPMPNNLVQAEASPSSDVSQFEQTSSEFVEISGSSQVAAVSDEHKQTDKLTESPDMIQENTHSENESVSVPEEEASQIPSKPHDSN